MHDRMRDPFSFYSEPRDAEPAHGYVLRRIGEEFHKSANVYLDRVMDERTGSIYSRSAELVRKMPMPEEARNRVLRCTPVRSREFVKLSGQRLMHHNLSITFRRFCPACIEESPHHRMWWDLACFQRCPLHRTALVRKNAHGKRYKWSWPFFAVDRYGNECGLFGERNVDTESFEHYIMQRLGWAPPIARPLLDDLPLDRVIDHSAILGRVVSNGYSRTAPRARDHDWSSGFSLLKGEISGLELGLETWLLKNTDQELRNQGDIAFGWIRSGSRNVEFGQSIDRAMKITMLRNGRLKRSAARGLEAKRREQSLLELCERHELPKLAMKHIIRSIGMPLARGRISYFDMDQVAAIDRFVKDLISPQEVAEMLGCTRRVVSGLIEKGRLRGLPLTGIGQGTQGLVPKADVEALLRKFKELPMSGESHSVYTVGTFSQREDSTDHDVVERVLSGALTLANIVPGRTGVAGWRLHIRHLAKQQRRPPRWHKPPPDCMTGTEAAVMTSIHPTTLSYVIKLGFIRHSRDNPLWLDRESVEIFHRKYVKLALFHRELGTTVRNVKPIARDLGVPLLFDTHGPRYQPIVARADIERLVGRHMSASPAAQDVWTRFKLAYEQGYSAFHMPMEIATWPQQIYLASRRSYFSFVADEDRVLVTKTFSPNSRREWPAFDGNRELFVHALKGFTWSLDGATEIASFSMQTDDDIKVVRLALDAVHWHIRKLIPIQEGRCRK